MELAPLIELREVSVQFGGERVLDHLSLHIRSGESVAIIGESGCGKSVLLKVMVGLMSPEQGEVLWEGIPLRERSPAELLQLRLKTGFVFQQAALFDSMTVFDNVAFALRVHRLMDESAIAAGVEERLREVGLAAAVAAKLPAALSGGMRKRVAIARALAVNPRVMFYDEPTTGLDPIMTDAINELILQTHQLRQLTTIIVTHEIRTVERCAERVIMLYPRSRLPAGDSQVLSDGPAAALFAADDLRVRHFVRGTRESSPTRSAN